jgi:hypothetical protein
MGIGTSILLIAVGAILRFAVTRNYIADIRIDTVGVILMIAGIIGLIISLLYLSLWSDQARRRDVYDDVPPAPRDRYY